VSHVSILDGHAELHLDRDDPMVGPLDDQVDLALATLRAQVPHPRLRRLSLYSHPERDQRLEQLAQQRAVPGQRRSQRGGVEQRADIRTEQPGGSLRYNLSPLDATGRGRCP